MATLILQDTYLALEEKIKSIDKLRTETSLKIKEAASHGDLKENYEYKAAKEAMSLVIYKKQLLQSHAPFRFVEYGEIETDEVEFGNKVTIHEEGKDEAEDYYLLGPIELELELYPMIVTYHTPFGQAMIGKKIGEYFTLEIKGKDTKFTITAIEKISETTPKCSTKE
jgi:transcription elongation factor GreA